MTLWSMDKRNFAVHRRAKRIKKLGFRGYILSQKLPCNWKKTDAGKTHAGYFWPFCVQCQIMGSSGGGGVRVFCVTIASQLAVTRKGLTIARV